MTERAYPARTDTGPPDALIRNRSGVVAGSTPRGSRPHSEEAIHETRTNYLKPCHGARVDTLHAVKTSLTNTTEVIPIADMDHLLSQSRPPSL
jgi:hypothetical protein